MFRPNSAINRDGVLVDNAETRLLMAMWVNCQSLLDQTAIRHALAHCLIRLTHGALHLTSDDVNELKMIVMIKDSYDEGHDG